METAKNLSEMLSYIQLYLKAPKDARNDFGKYNYRNADSILVAFKKTVINVDLIIKLPKIQKTKTK